MTSQNKWRHVNTCLIAKAIRELVFEQVISIAPQHGRWFIRFAESTWSFTGIPGIWGDIRVDPQSIQREPNLEYIEAAQFFMDAKNVLGVDDITLANFLEEMHKTLHADMVLIQKNEELSSDELAILDGETIQTYLNGHPKLILNKGRLGWGVQDAKEFAPENGRPLRFVWVALKKEMAISGGESPHLLVQQSLDANDLSLIAQKLSDQGLDLNHYVLIPVHPWQWDYYIATQFVGDLAKKNLIFLGEYGDYYQPQISLRTFSNKSRPSQAEIKLPLSILNTSAIRGLSAKYAQLGPKLSLLLRNLCQKDQLLLARGTEILEERGGIFYPHADFKHIQQAPYRYHEFLGALWRQSTRHKITDHDQQAIMTGALCHKDYKDKPLVLSLIERSGLDAREWISAYTRHVIIPLYHLQLHYGIGLVAHGQNIILKLEQSHPCGVILKDFQGDLRFAQSHADKYKEFSDIDVLPDHYLIHDLFTGHFITVMRYVSGLLNDSETLSEDVFYQCIAKQITDYLHEYKHNIPENINLLARDFDRVLVNKVRFHIGYGDNAARPLPMLGDRLINPLYNPELV